MKTLRSLFLTAVLLSVVHFGGGANEAQAGVVGQSMSECSAATQCGYYLYDAYGRPYYFVNTHNISCFVYANANAGTACRWEFVFNGYVRCEGLDAYGNWGVFGQSCY